MNYHVALNFIIGRVLIINKGQNELIEGLIYQYLQHDVTYFDGQLLNTSLVLGMNIYQTEKAIDDEYPVNASKYNTPDGRIDKTDLNDDRISALKREANNVTEELLLEAKKLIKQKS